MKILPIWVCLQALFTEHRCLPVFDCRNPDTTYEVIDLLEPTNCPEPDRDYAALTQIPVQVLQTDISLPIMGYQCKATVSKEVTRCGFDSLTYASQYPVWKRDYEIMPNQSRKALQGDGLEVEGERYDVKIGR